MYIVPILAVKKKGGALQQVWLFLERNGNHLIHLDALPSTAIAAAKEFVELNEMPIIDEPLVIDDLVFVKVDPNSKDIHSFYTWQEVPPGTIPSRELWRPFLWVSAEDNTDPLGVNRLLDGISLSERGHTVYSAITAASRLVLLP